MLFPFKTMVFVGGNCYETLLRIGQSLAKCTAYWHCNLQGNILEVKEIKFVLRGYCSNSTHPLSSQLHKKPAYIDF